MIIWCNIYNLEYYSRYIIKWLSIIKQKENKNNILKILKVISYFTSEDILLNIYCYKN